MSSDRKNEYRMLIDGDLIVGEYDENHMTNKFYNNTFNVYNPANEGTFAYCPMITQNLAEKTIYAAEKAFHSWKKTSVNERKKCLQLAFEIFKLHKDELAITLTAEQGKSLKDSYAEIKECYELFNKNLQLNVDEIVDEYKGTKQFKVITKRVPLGLCALITPWNYPIFTAIQKMCPAIMTGNTVILKPSPYTPLSSLILGKIFCNIFPNGVFNVITGGDDGMFQLGKFLTNHPKVSKISFTGSTATGRQIMTAATTNFKRITLEMGGNDAAIIRGDVNIYNVAQKVFDSAFANIGALCCAIKRVYVHETIFDKFVNAMVEIAERVVVGDGFLEDTEYGPINNKMQLERGIELLNDAIKNGAKIECGGKRIGDRGYFFKPTILTKVHDDIRLVKEEQFFPTLPILSYKTDEEAITRANNTEYGLGGSVWSRDVKKAVEMANELRVGTSWVNSHSALTGGEFGGRVGSSGFGRELGKADLYAFTESQTFMIPREISLVSCDQHSLHK